MLPAMCGVTNAFGSASNACPGSGGSSTIVSSTACRSGRSCNTSINSGSFTTAPRAVLMKVASRFIRRSSTPSISASVPAYNGKWQ